ncbi:hypothetical protein PV372_42385, partial [Streptomyces scabiei]|nr:hypothetical protein [Streptomyces scabiei]
MTDKIALTPDTHTAPPAKFSHGVRKGNILQVAGQVGFPEWAAIRMGLFGRDAFVPLEPSELVEGTLRVP